MVAGSIEAMTIQVGMVTIDTTDEQALAAWWGERLGGQRVFDDGGYVVLSLGDAQPALAFQRVADPTPGKNRVHLDLTTRDLDADVVALAAAGAEVVDEHDLGDGNRWVTMTDPDGNLFCVAEHAPTVSL